MPPESWAGRCSARASSRTRARAARTRRSISARAVRRSRSPKATFSNTERCGKSAYDWKTIPSPRWWAGRSVTSWPSIRTRPAVGSTKPAIRLRVVVLPQPDGPSSESSSPSYTTRSRPATARTPSYSRLQPASSTTGRAIRSVSPVVEEHAAQVQEPVGEPDDQEGAHDEEGRERRDGRIRVVDHVAEHRHREDLGQAGRDEERDHELVQRHDHREEQRGQEAGTQERQRDPPEGPPGRGAQARGGALEGGIEVAYAVPRRAHHERQHQRHVGHDQHGPAPQEAERRAHDEEAQAGRDTRHHQRRKQQRGPEGGRPGTPAGQAERRRARGDQEAVPHRALELRIGHHVHVPAQREPARGKGQDRGRVERDRHDHDGRQGHEREQEENSQPEHHAPRSAIAVSRPTPASKPSVTTSAITANAAPPGQLKESSARSRTTLAIILTRPPPRSSGVAKALRVQAKTITEPDTTPGIESGSVTRRNTRAGLAPRLAAARSYTGSTWLIAAASRRIIVGIEKCTSPTRTPRVVKSMGIGHVTTVLPRTSTQA